MPITNVGFHIRLYTSEPLENGKYPVVLQISWRDVKPHVRRKRLGMACLPSEFDRENNCIKKTARSHVRKNQEMQDALNKAVGIYNDLIAGEPWDYKKWANLYDNKVAHVTFDSYAREVIDKFYAMQKAGTGTFYRDALRAIQKFMGNETIEFEELTRTVLRNFESDIISRGFKGDRIMRGLKGIYSKAVEDGMVDMKLMPFKTAYNPIGYKFTHLKKIKKRSSWMKRLSVQQVKTLVEYKPLNESEERAMDLWKFSYYTMGVNLKDIGLMRASDIRDGLWFFERSKTSNSSLGKPLLPECQAIINKYSDPNNKYVFDFILQDKYDVDDKSINVRTRDVASNLRRRYNKIAKALDFPGHFTFYSARYTSATISANKGADMRAVQANLAHTSLTTTEIYTQFRNEESMRESLELLRL